MKQISCSVATSPSFFPVSEEEISVGKVTLVFVSYIWSKLSPNSWSVFSFCGIFDLWWLQPAPSSICDYRELVILESWVLNLFSPVPHVVVFSAKGFYRRRTGWWIRSIPKIPCPGNVSSVSGFDSNSRWWVSRAKAAVEERKCGIRAIMASSSWLSLPVAHHGLSLCGQTSLCCGLYTLLKRTWHF